MILIVCPNLAIDATLEIDRLEPGAVHRATGASRQAGGKGVNVARALRSLGHGDEPLVLGFAGGRIGEEIAEAMAGEEIRAELVPIAGESRTCTILLERGGAATVVNEPGPRVGEGSQLLSRFEDLLKEARAVALMGSLPPGVPSGVYARMVESSRQAGRPTLVDTSGPALRESLSRGPDVVKPNLEEAESLLGRGLGSETSRLEALREIRGLGAGTAILTLGARGFLADGGGSRVRCSVPVPDLRVGNPTGAGDALAGGYLAGLLRGEAPADRLRLAAAAAAASLARGYGRFRPEDLRLEAVALEPL